MNFTITIPSLRLPTLADILALFTRPASYAAATAPIRRQVQELKDVSARQTALAEAKCAAAEKLSDEAFDLAEEACSAQIVARKLEALLA